MKPKPPGICCTDNVVIADNTNENPVLVSYDGTNASASPIPCTGNVQSLFAVWVDGATDLVTPTSDNMKTITINTDGLELDYC